MTFETDIYFKIYFILIYLFLFCRMILQNMQVTLWQCVDSRRRNKTTGHPRQYSKGKQEYRMLVWEITQDIKKYELEI